MLSLRLLSNRNVGMIPALQYYLLLAALTALYFLAGKFGLYFFGLVHPSASAVWPPTGVAIAALLLFGYRVWPAVFVGALLVNITTAGSFVSSLGIATGNTLEGLAAACLVNRFAHGRHAFERASDVLKFMGLAALLSTMISATLGVGSLTLTGHAPLSEFGAIWLTWWLGDASGAIIITPLLMLWYRDYRWRWGAKRFIEAAVLLVITVSVGAVIFFTPLLAPYPLAFLCLPLLVWAAFRFRQREVATAVVLLAVMATWATATGHGPFIMSTPNDSLLVLQAFMGVVAVTALPMAALAAERALLLEQEQAANRGKDEFLAMLSHELRNPLGAITTATAILDRLDGPRGETARWREMIQRQTKHLAHLIDDLLDTARVAAGKMVLTRQPIDLAVAVERCVQTHLLAGDSQRHQIELECTSAWVSADPDRLAQIIDNLILNAIKYTQPGGNIRVRVCADGRYAVLEVMDTGVGITPTMLTRIFDLFVQGDQDLARTKGGIGIGLTLVRRLLELHGGNVEAQSDGPGRGSRFVVRLPRIDTPMPNAVRATLEAEHLTRRYRILLIEDNADVRLALRALLEIAGHEVHEAVDGSTGIQVALRLQPDVTLIDIGLPGLDGYEVARQIKSANRTARLIAMTGYGRDEDIERAHAAGFDAHLLKPVGAERLQAVMDELCVREPLVSRPVVSR